MCIYICIRNRSVNDHRNVWVRCVTVVLSGHCYPSVFRIFVSIPIPYCQHYMRVFMGKYAKHKKSVDLYGYLTLKMNRHGQRYVVATDG